MDRQEYLNQISAANRPEKKSGKGILSSKFFWVGAVGVVAFIVIMIIGSMLGGGNNSVKDKIFSLILHINNTSEIISEYQSSVKSSDLRSYSASLNGLLSGASKDLTDYATEKYSFKEKDVKEEITEEETLAKDDLKSALFEAKINGNLDRIYAHRMAYEISLITTREAQIIKAVDNDMLKKNLGKSYDSLGVLYNNFNNFSETK